MEIIRHRPETLAVLSGDDALALPVIALGGEGVISVAANAFPEEVSTMVRNMLGGHYEDARTIHYALLEFITALFVEGNPCGINAESPILGIAGNLVRIPLVPVSEGTYQKMESLIKELSLTDAPRNRLWQPDAETHRRVLLICSSYDVFMLEEDGRIDEQIFNEYASLH
jgi:dihydrodipicolinate synthase/N-acetylneuraminate lyase